MKEAMDILRITPIFENLEERDLSRIAACGVRKAYRKSDLILMEEETGSVLFVIISGKVKVVRIGEDGREIILSIMSSGEVFGEMALLDGESRSASVIALEDSDLFMIHGKDFVSLLHEYPAISVSLLKQLTQRLRKADALIKSLSLKDAFHRIGYVLLQFAEERGKIRQGRVEIEDLPVQQEIANMAGTTRETVSRTLTKMEKMKLIDVKNNNVSILNYDVFREKFS